MQPKLPPILRLLLLWCAVAPSCEARPDRQSHPDGVNATGLDRGDSRPHPIDLAPNNSGVDSPPPGILADAEQGDIAPMMFLGRMYAEGSGVRQNHQEALRWYRKAAELGFAPAMRQVGGVYLSGSGVAQDDREAVLWFRKAAELGDEDAMVQLGLAYANGQGIGRDAKEAVGWFRKASDSGHVGAMYGLGVSYQHGAGVEQDDAAAARWYLKAALRGNMDAMINLGVCYAEGRGVPEDLVAAYAWSNVAGASGAELAVVNREKLKRTMTPGQVADGQTMTRELLAQQARSKPSPQEEMNKAFIKARQYMEQRSKNNRR